jgi:hypothetical protein
MNTRPCRKCGKDIFFAVNRKTGRSVPLDARSTVVYELDEESRRMDPDEPRVIGRPAYISHFVTCPFADEFRKAR